MNYRILRAIGITAILLIAVVTVSALWFGMQPTVWFVLCIKAVTLLRGYSMLAIGIAIMLLVLVVEWQAILNNRRLIRMSLAQVEFTHPRFPNQAETIITILFTIALTLLFFQFTSQVFAFAFVLTNSSTETYQSEQIFMFDYENDGDMDYIVINGGSDPYDIYKNNGGGGFTRAEIGMGGNAAHTSLQAAAGDVDNDGDIDFVINETIGVPIHQISIYKNTGAAGTWTATSTITVTNERSGLALVDVDSDGDLDIVTTESSAAVTDAVYVNNGHGTFTAANSTLPASDYLAAADVDSDGDQDLILGIAITSKVYKNSGTGAFTSLGTFGFAQNGSFPVVGDLDSDGDIDVLIARSTDGKIRPYLNDGAGAFSNGTEFGGVEDTKHVALGDVDNDGDFDAIIAGFDSGGTNAGNEVWLNNGNGTFTQTGLPTEESDCTNNVAIGELDGDESLDYVAVNQGCSSGGAANRNYINDSTNGNPSAIGPDSLAVTLYSQNNRITSVDTGGDVGKNTSIKIGSDGLPVIAYQDASNFTLKVIKCGNASCSTGNTTTTVSTGVISNGISMAIPSDGFPVISFYVANLTVVKCGNASCSSGNTTTVVDQPGGTDVGLYSSIAIGTDNLPIISYYDNTNLDLKVTHCGNATCTSGNSTTSVDTSGNVGLYTSITVPSDGQAIISYYDATNGNLVIGRCGAVVCVSITKTTPDSTGDVGQYTSAAIYPTTGYPVVAYYDVTNTNPKFLKCGNADCSSGNNIVNLDNGVFGANDGQHTAIAIGNDGLPVVTFYDASNTRLGFSKFTNAALTSSNGTSVETGGSNGTYTSVAVPSSGHPIVSYYDATNGNLKVVKCGNPSCNTIVGGVPLTDGGSPIHRLAWGSGSDTITPAKLLQYQVKMGTGSSANNIVSGATAGPNYVSRVMPDGQARTMYIKNLTCNSALTYYWSVAVMDPGFKKSWSSQSTFALNSDCSMGTVGSAPASSSSSAAGGGLDHRIFDRKDDGGSMALYSLPISFVNDLNGNGRIDGREQPIRFAGIPVTASGRTIAGVEIHTTLTLSDKGDTVFRLPIANAKGYTISVDESFLGGYRLTGPTTLTGVVVSPSGTGISFGVKSSILLQYKPCLRIGEKHDDETSGSDAWILLQRLEDPYGLRILRDVESKQQILSRRSFFTILARIACMSLETDPTMLKEGIRKRSAVALPLVDLPFSVTSKDSLLVHSLLAAGVDVTRETAIGPAADLNSPIARSEILRAVASLFPAETAMHKKSVESYVSSSTSRASSLGLEPVTSTSSEMSASSSSSVATLNPIASSLNVSSAASIVPAGVSTIPFFGTSSSAASTQGASASAATFTNVTALSASSVSSSASSSAVMQTLSSLSTTIQTSLQTAVGLSSTSSSASSVEPFVGLPTDIDVTDDTAPDYLALDGLKILPQSFRTIFGLDLGVTTQEASLLLVRTAFRLGRIPLLPDIEEENAKSAAPPETFMSLLPSELKLACLEEDPDRAMTVIFTDILPGDPLFTEVHSLLSLKIKNGDDKDQWLLAATRRPTELGVAKGQLKAVLDEPVSVLETLRTLLVLSCMPPETRIELIQNGGKITSQGSAATRVARDMLSDLPRDVSFASRVMYKSQDHQKEFDLSLLGYAPSLLRGEARSPAESFSVEEAGDVLASAVLGIAVREKQITPQAAEGMANVLATAIRKDLAGEDIDWRSEEILRKTPFTRGMLFKFLASVIDSSPLSAELAGEEMPATGQLWWDRIK